MDERDTTAVIDRALASGAASSSDPRERELEELALLLAAEAPTADPAFAEELGERVREGFPRAERRTEAALAGPFRRLRETRALRALGRPRLAALGGAASILVAVAIAFSLTGDGTREAALDGGATSPSEESSSSPESSGAQEVGGAVRDSIEPAPAAPKARSLRSQDHSARVQSFALPRRSGGFAPSRRERRVERSAALVLAAPEDRLDRVAERISAVTERHGGFVLRSSLTTGEEGLTTGGDFDLRIPVQNLRRGLRDLAALGQVRSRTQTGDDVTVAFVTVGDRLESARAERRGLLRRLESAETDVEAEALRLQLDANAARIGRLRGQLRGLRARTDYAAVTLSLEARDGEGASAPGDGIGGAIDDAVESLGDSLELAIRVLGVAIPLGLVAAALAFTAKAIRRRRREAALS